MGIGVVLNYVVPEKAFGYVTSVATAAGIWTWMMILISHIRYRRAVDAGRLPASSFPAPGGAVLSWIALVFLLFVTGLIAYDPESRVCLYVDGRLGRRPRRRLGGPARRRNPQDHRAPRAGVREGRLTGPPDRTSVARELSCAPPVPAAAQASGIWAVPYHPRYGAARLLILATMLTITQALYDQIVAHAREDHPDEACGVVAGPAGSDRPERFIPMLNAATSPTFYEFDSGDLLKLYREMDDRDEEPVVIYHSHTATEAYPSRTDISYANEPGAHYVLVSTATPTAAALPVPLVPHRGRRGDGGGGHGRGGVLITVRRRPTRPTRRRC